MNWRDIRDCVVKFESGSRLGILEDLCLSPRGGRILYLKTSPPLLWRVLRGRLMSKPDYIPSEMARYLDPDVLILDRAIPDANEDVGQLARISRLNNTEVYAGRGWRIGRLVDVRFDPETWTLEEIDVDAYPEYMISSGTHSRVLPEGFPPVSRVTVRGDGATFRSAENLEGGTNVILTVGGREIEKNLVELLMDLDNRMPPVEEQTCLVQEAFDRAYGGKTQDTT